MARISHDIERLKALILSGECSLYRADPRDVRVYAQVPDDELAENPIPGMILLAVRIDDTLIVVDYTEGSKPTEVDVAEIETLEVDRRLVELFYEEGASPECFFSLYEAVGMDWVNLRFIFRTADFH